MVGLFLCSLLFDIYTQLSSYYSLYCSGIFSCIVDPSLEITAVNAADDVRAPPPFVCKPGIVWSGYWDTNTGTEIKNTPYANTAGRIDVAGEHLCVFVK
jgi:hypothetical protein